MLKSNKILLDAIEREKAGIDYCYTVEDKAILDEMIKKINERAKTNIQYLAELDFGLAVGVGETVAEYVTRFSSESVRAFLLPQLYLNKVKDCDRLIIQLYLHFKASDAYVSKPDSPAPAHIHVRYDSAFKNLKPKRLKSDLLKLAQCPRDAFYLPFTMRMLSSWKMPEMEEILLSYLSEPGVSAKDVGLENLGDNYFPPLSFMRRELAFTAIQGLKYYPSEKAAAVLERYALHADPDIRCAVKKTMDFLCKKN